MTTKQTLQLFAVTFVVYHFPNLAMNTIRSNFGNFGVNKVISKLP